MQFPKAKRFTDKPPDSIPPPGAYNVPVHSPQQNYKRAAMTDRASRFADPLDHNKPDTFGLYVGDPLATDKENAKPRIRTTSTTANPAERERHKAQLEELRARMTAAHDKETAKLRAKLDKLDEARQEHRKEREELYKEADKLKTDNRHLTSKLSRATALQEKYEATLPSLQAKLSTLTTQHAASSAKKDADLSQLRIALSRAEADTDEARAQARAWEDRARAEQRARDDAALAAGELAARLRDEARVARADDLYAERCRTAALERRLADRDAVLASVVAHAQALEEQLALADAERLEAEWREWRVRDAWREDRALLVGPGRDEKEWRQRARADGREMDGLRDDVALAERERADEREWDAVRREWERRRDKAAREDKKRFERDFEVVEGELDLAVNDEIPRLEALLAASESSLSTARSDLSHATAQLAQLESDLVDLETRRQDDAERFEGELEEQRRLVAEARREAERERVEKRRVVGILAQTRASEGALKDEVDSLAQQVAQLDPLVTITADLEHKVDHLERLCALSEAEARDLVAHNSELAGHANSGQKIRHVAMIREELADTRRKHAATQSQLSTATTRIKALELELDLYRPVGATATPSSVGTVSAAPGGRTRVARPMMADVLDASAAAPVVRAAPRPRATAPTATPTPAASAAAASAAPPPRLVVVPAHDSLAAPPFAPSSSSTPTVQFARSTSALPPHAHEPTSAWSVAPDEPLLPAGLARSAGPAPASKAGGGAPVRSAMAGGRTRRKSTSVKMQGTMSVSELF
ncbi:hypothetical protein JCM8208_005234 [Rhodotorula glutinis]